MARGETGKSIMTDKEIKQARFNAARTIEEIYFDTRRVWEYLLAEDASTEEHETLMTTAMKTLISLQEQLKKDSK
jgi:hypothetical protein